MIRCLTVLLFFIFASYQLPSYSEAQDHLDIISQDKSTDSGLTLIDLPLDTVSANGFGGSGGFDFCTKVTGFITQINCFSAIEFGFRVTRVPDYVDLKPLLDESNLQFVQRDPTETERTPVRWRPSEATVQALEDINARLPKEYSFLDTFALNQGDFDVFEAYPDFDPKNVLEAWYEYIRLLPKDSRFLYLAFVHFDQATFGQGYVASAISNDKRTYLFKYFFYLSPERKALKLIHEAMIRSCHSKEQSDCLHAALYFDGLLFDFLNNKNLTKTQMDDFLGFLREMSAQHSTL